MRVPLESVSIFSERRKILAEKIQGSVMIIPSHPEYIRNHDVHHPYRVDSNLYYLTGFEEPESIFIFRAGINPESILFVRSKDPLRETWDGFRYGPQAAKEHYGVDVTHPLEDFDKLAPQYLQGAEKLYYRLFKNIKFDEKIRDVMEAYLRSYGRSGWGLLPILDPGQVLGEMRVVKSDYEVELMREACRITAETHVEAMKAARPGMNERQIHGLILQQFLHKGASREGYNSIVATGLNATTLHYVFNDQPFKADDLLLIDAGAEYKYYTGDITRTFPVSGKFTDAQAELYQAVLDVQLKVIQMVRPGEKFENIRMVAEQLLAQVMIDLGLLNGTLDQILQSKAQKKYYPHGIGHWLGMDVHDAGTYFNMQRESVQLVPNMCLTIEPGIYVPANDLEAPARFRGLGIRIEDNILVTEKGHENMTSMCPKHISEIESLMQKGRS